MFNVVPSRHKLRRPTSSNENDDYDDGDDNDIGWNEERKAAKSIATNYRKKSDLWHSKRLANILMFGLILHTPMVCSVCCPLFQLKLEWSTWKEEKTDRTHHHCCITKWWMQFSKCINYIHSQVSISQFQRSQYRGENEHNSMSFRIIFAHTLVQAQ